MTESSRSTRRAANWRLGLAFENVSSTWKVSISLCNYQSPTLMAWTVFCASGGTPMTGHSGGSSSSSGGAPAMGPSKRKKRNAGGGGGGGGGGGMMMGHTAECSAEVEACMMMMYINLAEHDMENMDDQEAALYMASLVNSPFQALMSDRAIHCIEELGHEQNDPEDLMHTPGHCREIVADLRMSAPEGKCFPDNVVNQQDLLMCLFPHADMATLTIHCPVSWTKDYMWLSHLLIECKDEVADYLATMAAGQVDGAINIDVDSCHMAKSGDPIDQCRHVLTPELNGYHDPDMDMGPPSMPRPAVVVGCIQAFMMDLNENPMDCKKLANSKWYWMAGQFDRYSDYFTEVGYEGLDCVKFEVCKDIISGMWVQNEPLPTTTEFSPPLLGGGGAGLPPPGSGGGGIPPWLLEDKRKKRNTDDMEDEDHDFCFIAPSMSVAVDAFACQALFVEDNKWVCPRVLPPELVPIFEAVLNDENCLMDFKDTMQVDDIDVDSCRMAVEHRLQECKVHGSMMTSHIPDNSVSVSNDEMMRKRKKRSSPPLPDINEWGEIAESGMVGGGGGGDMMDHGCKSMAAKECKAMVKKNIMKHEPTCEDVSYSAWGFLPGSPLADCLDEDMKVAVAQCPDPRECRKSVLDKIVETNPEHEGKIKWLKNMMQRYEGGLMTGLAKEQQMAGEFGGGHMMGHGHMKRKKRNAAGNGNGGRKCLPANAATLLRDCLPFKGVDATVRCPAKPDSEWFFWAFVIDHLPGCADEIKTIMQVDIDVQSCKTAYENARDKMTETFLKEMDCVYQMQPLNDEDSKFLRNWLDDNDNKVICKGDPFVPFLNRIIDQNKFCYAYFYMDLKKASPDQSCMPMDHCTEQCRFLENLLSGNTGTILDDFDIDKLFANTDFCGVMTANAVSEHKESYYQLGSLGMSTTTTTTEAGGKTTATTESGGSKTSPTLAATAILTLVLAKFIIIF